MVSKIKKQIQQAQESLSNAEYRLEELHEKLYRQNFKRRRKALRKKLANDPIFRATYKIQQNILKTLFKESLPESGEMIGLTAIIGGNNGSSIN